jgi:prevent-host-death family protein
MPVYTVHEAKTHLSKLIERAERGEEVIIARGDKPAARLTAATEPAKKKGRRFGAYKGIVPEFPDSFFFDPLPEDELKLWNCEEDGGTEDDKASAR